MGTSILVIDDDEVLGRVLSRVLKGHGHTVLLATGPEQGLRLAREYHPAVALVDLCMPGADGVEVARQLREELGDVRLILMTAYPLRLRERPELDRLFARVLVKPLDLAGLLQAVQAAPAVGNGVAVAGGGGVSAQV